MQRSGRNIPDREDSKDKGTNMRMSLVRARTRGAWGAQGGEGRAGRGRRPGGWGALNEALLSAYRPSARLESVLI